MKTFISGLLLGAMLASLAIGLHARMSDATPVYQEGYADGFAEAREPMTDMECELAYGGEL